MTEGDDELDGVQPHVCGDPSGVDVDFSEYRVGRWGDNYRDEDGPWVDAVVVAGTDESPGSEVYLFIIPARLAPQFNAWARREYARWNQIYTKVREEEKDND